MVKGNRGTKWNHLSSVLLPYYCLVLCFVCKPLRARLQIYASQAPDNTALTRVITFCEHVVIHTYKHTYIFIFKHHAQWESIAYLSATIVLKNITCMYVYIYWGVCVRTFTSAFQFFQIINSLAIECFPSVNKHIFFVPPTHLHWLSIDLQVSLLVMRFDCVISCFVYRPTVYPPSSYTSYRT